METPAVASRRQINKGAKHNTEQTTEYKGVKVRNEAGWREGNRVAAGTSFNNKFFVLLYTGRSSCI